MVLDSNKKRCLRRPEDESAWCGILLGAVFQIKDFAPRTRNRALFAQEVYSYRTRPEKKGPDDTVIWTKDSFENSP